ncbi:MAG: CehA/McbA family metallohydrolase [Candidatus Bathyarchaeota archaeon]
MQLKFDLHIHTTYSKDSSITVEEAIKRAENVGLDGIAITDHNSIEAHRKIPGKSSLIVIPGIEVSSHDGHILGLGVTNPIARGLSAFETVEKIHSMGGVAVVAHPGSLLRNSVKNDVLKQLKTDAVETVNSHLIFASSIKKAKKLAESLGLSQTGGSDSHILATIGKAYTLIDVATEDADDVLKAVRDGKTKAEGDVISTIDRLIEIRVKLKNKLRV